MMNAECGMKRGRAGPSLRPILHSSFIIHHSAFGSVTRQQLERLGLLAVAAVAAGDGVVAGGQRLADEVGGGGLVVVGVEPLRIAVERQQAFEPVLEPEEAPALARDAGEREV